MDLTVVEGIATTRVARTLVDLAGVLPQGPTERRHGLPEPARQVDVGDDHGWVGRVDFAYADADARLVIELDSRRHHSSKLDVEADAARDSRLRDASWRVVRFCLADVVVEEPIFSLIRTLPVAL